jgi:hypothetical protein
MARAGQLDPGSWRDKARRTIQRAIAANAQLHGDPPALFKHINKTCYPFGERKHLPYKMWLLELRIQRENFARTMGGLYGSPIERTCLACGAKPGRRCKNIGPEDQVNAALAVAADAELEGRMSDAAEILTEAYHEVRLASVRRVQLGSGPLFDRAEEDS